MKIKWQIYLIIIVKLLSSNYYRQIIIVKWIVEIFSQNRTNLNGCFGLQVIKGYLFCSIIIMLILINLSLFFPSHDNASVTRAQNCCSNYASLITCNTWNKNNLCFFNINRFCYNQLYSEKVILLLKRWLFGLEEK
jgi:hypothetical protein